MHYPPLRSPTQEVLQATNHNRLLDKLQEEAAEVIQAVSKIRRFGEHNHHPDRTTTNRQELVNELEDFLAILAQLESCGWLDPKPDPLKITHKAQQLARSA
jgi:phosphoribosyl-ATP pyrophosphohydrolase